MWGQIVVEASFQQNFNFGFSTYKSDILLHLSQWQYWWWFWFSLLWVLYYYVIVQCITRRTHAFNPVLNTSLRGHGKWGDFLVALIPLSWCGNILINSNFILRMIEWQNEASLFTLRVQGKQWYWVYKIDSTAATSILSAPKNIGHNKWFIWTPNDVLVSDSYYEAMQLAAQVEYHDAYRDQLDSKEVLGYSGDEASLISNKLMSNKNFIIDKTCVPTSTAARFPLIKSNFPVSGWELTEWMEKKATTQFCEDLEEDTTVWAFDFLLEHQCPNSSSLYKFEKVKTNSFSTHYDYLRVDDTHDNVASVRPAFAKQPLRFVKTPLNLFIIENLNTITNENYFITTLWNINSDGLEEKIDYPETFWKMRQKKYARPSSFLFQNSRITYDPITFKPIGVGSVNKVKRRFTEISLDYLSNDTSLTAAHLDARKQKKVLIKSEPTWGEEYFASLEKKKKFNKEVTDPSVYYTNMRSIKARTELLSVTLARRLLRVKQTLVLPAHVNITVITNSYDVVHSWFIPGLGLKMDCVPGRSTHHTFYIDNVGLYYGQCAEICGRYHHHMPIRICALTFDQFLVWWQKKGLLNVHRIHEHGSVKSTNKFFNANNQEACQKNLGAYISNMKATAYQYNW